MENFFQAVSRQMADQIKTIGREISGAGMKGDSGEELIRQFLTKYLPKRYAVAQGKVVDFAGNESRQIDIIVYDALNTIPFFTDERNSIIPVENVHAIVEVKTTINKTKFIDALGVFQSIFNLQTPVTYLKSETIGLVEKDITLYDHFRLHPKCFLIGLDSDKSVTAEALMHTYLGYAKEKQIKFPLLSFCGIVNENFFTDNLKEEYAEHADEPCEVHLSKSDDNTLLYFLLNLLDITNASLDARKPDYSLYLTFYNKVAGKKRLSDGWLYY